LTFAGESNACFRHAIPWECRQVVKEHKSEIYHAAFSHNGTMLATAGKDGTIIVWVVGHELVKYKQFVLEEKSVNFVAWNKDDSMILGCSEQLVAVWNVAVRNLTLTKGKPSVGSPISPLPLCRRRNQSVKRCITKQRLRVLVGQPMDGISCPVASMGRLFYRCEGQSQNSVEFSHS